MTPRATPGAVVPDWPSLVYANLRRGRDKASSLSELAESMGCPRRVIEQAVQGLRMGGFAVATGRDGCWVADKSADLDTTIASMQSRLISQYQTLRAVRATRGRLRAFELRGEVELLALWPSEEAA